ncbi:50S ribosomal protein L10 [Neisseria gonorrhoeae]|uniref:50S ribosomal protein L10 n=1 Tax=Neisseria gonorrhoeae TaxID=485 RepID=A0A379B0L0_NEIGO|nr:50S ribosomal protein L10 [Neisseria gonorrhoeae]
MNAAQVAELASIPSREELLSKLLFVMQAPVSGFARGLAALAEKKPAKKLLNRFCFC